LVTGAEGFIGSTLVDRLVERGATVRAFVHYKPYAERGNLARYLGDPDSPVTVRAGDLRDSGQLIDAVAGCDTVFHLGALIGIPYSYAAPQSYVQTNIEGTLNVLTACRENGAATVDAHEGEPLGLAVLLHDLVRDANEGPAHVVAVEDDLLFGHTSFLASQDRVKGTDASSVAAAMDGA
jgi:GDP-D-mannose dehydratase